MLPGYRPHRYREAILLDRSFRRTASTLAPLLPLGLSFGMSDEGYRSLQRRWRWLAPHQLPDFPIRRAEPTQTLFRFAPEAGGRRSEEHWRPLLHASDMKIATGIRRTRA